MDNCNGGFEGKPKPVPLTQNKRRNSIRGLAYKGQGALKSVNDEVLSEVVECLLLCRLGGQDTVGARGHSRWDGKNCQAARSRLP